MFARRMLEMEADSQYADVMGARCTTPSSAVALDGKHFFYVNPAGGASKIVKFNHILITLSPSASAVWLRLLPAEHRPRAHLSWSLHLHAACGVRCHIQYVQWVAAWKYR